MLVPAPGSGPDAAVGAAVQKWRKTRVLSTVVAIRRRFSIQGFRKFALPFVLQARPVTFVLGELERMLLLG
jgi:hypothetical protein